MLLRGQNIPWHSGVLMQHWNTGGYVAMTKPYYTPLIAYPKAWTSGTGKKMLTSDIILITATDSAGLMQYAGKLKGKIVMTQVMDTLRPSFDPDGQRFA